MRIQLFEHNQTAYESALSMLYETGKAAIVHPTGTGKSFIGFKLCEDFPEKAVCWLSPSEYIFKTQLDNLKATGAEVPDNIKFFTYARLMNMSEAEMAAIQPELVIFDEFHRAGAVQWGSSVQKFLKLYPETPVLGLSATAVRYLDNQRDMADELFDGNVASEMTLGEAIVRGILNPPKYVLSVFSYQKALERYRSRVERGKNKAVRDAAEKYLEALRRALERADGLDVIFDRHMTDCTGKYIVFCANFEHMQEMIGKAGEWFSKVDRNPHIYSVYSDDPSASKAFAGFKADNDNTHLRLLFCIDALNEGIHVENVSGVILLRPTVSPIIYKQQIGRALSASQKTDTVIFDVVMNIENLYSIDCVEAEMRTAMTYYRSLGNGSEIVNEQFRVIDELRDCRELFEKLNDTLTASWDMMYGYAKAYFETHGDLEVPRRYKTADGYSLGNWIATQRKIYRGAQNGVLGEDRIKSLSSIGMIWDWYGGLQWTRNYDAAKSYYERNKNLRVPAGYVTENGIFLGAWIQNLCTCRKSNIRNRYLTPERIAELDKIGMIWNVPDYQWETNYSAAVRYHGKHGNLDMPVCYVDEDGIRLGEWLNNMRRAKQNKDHRITDEQIRKLDRLGMVWETEFSRRWELGYATAKAYYEAHGNLDVPAMYQTDSGYKLGDWVCNQREKYRSGGMKSERIERLNEIGMIWRKDDPWEMRFALAEAYYREHGDLNLPDNYKVNGICLSKWVNEQKEAFRGNRKQHLTGEQIQRLEAIGIEWRNANEVIWEGRYQAVKDYFDKHGNLDIPKRAILSDGRTIGAWLTVQRGNYKKGKLTDEQKAKLNAVGMVWEPADVWEVGFAHAESYFREHGSLNVPRDHVCADGYPLGGWISNQRSSHNNPTQYHYLTDGQVKRLESVGMVWDAADKHWHDVYELAVAYYREYGDLSIPVRYKAADGTDLWEWTRVQRDKRRKGSLPGEYIQKLNSIGMDWLFPTEREWETFYTEAERYFRVCGNLHVPVTYRTDNGPWLGRWIARQRQNRLKLKADGANGDQVRRLEQIGMIWEDCAVSKPVTRHGIRRIQAG